MNHKGTQKGGEVTRHVTVHTANTKPPSLNWAEIMQRGCCSILQVGRWFRCCHDNNDNCAFTRLRRGLQVEPFHSPAELRRSLFSSFLSQPGADVPGFLSFISNQGNLLGGDLQEQQLE